MIESANILRRLSSHATDKQSNRLAASGRQLILRKFMNVGVNLAAREIFIVNAPMSFVRR
jgi:hypothetical protein